MDVITHPRTHPRILWPMPAEMAVRTQGGSIKTFFLSVKSSQYDRKWHALVRDGHRSTAKLLFSAGYIRVSCGLYGPPAGVSRRHRGANTRSLLRQSFEHDQNLSVGKSDLHAHLRASSGEIRVKQWQARAFCGELRAAKIIHRNMPARLSRKVVTGALILLQQHFALAKRCEVIDYFRILVHSFNHRLSKMPKSRKVSRRFLNPCRARESMFTFSDISQSLDATGSLFTKKMPSNGYRNRPSADCLRIIMEIPIPIRQCVLCE